MGERHLDERQGDRHYFRDFGAVPSTRDSPAASDSHPRPRRPRTGTPACPDCGALRRPELPQPLAAALLLTRTLTPRERTVFRLLGLGYDNRSIARELKISERTVKRYVTAILTKLELRSRLQAGLSALMFSWSVAMDPCWPEGLMDSARAAGDDAAYDTGGDHDL
jgi:DNA-binding CsgD family transcriptional regulator